VFFQQTPWQAGEVTELVGGLVNHVVGMPAGIVEMQVKYHRGIGAEIAVTDAHERQWTLKTCVGDLYAHFGFHQLGILVLTIFNRADAVNL
jgi:hypothetical protein